MTDSSHVWLIVTVLLAGLAVAAPLLLRKRKADPAKDEDRRTKQREVVDELDRVLQPILAPENSEPVRIGPGTPLYDAYMNVRTRIRYDFRSTTGIRFDRELGYLLNRPDTIVPGSADLREKVRLARGILYEEIDG